jgi:predicted amidohydrolase
MRVALYQCPPLPLEPAGNLQRLQQLAMEAKGADLLVLPEMFLSGYNIGKEAVSTWPRSTTANRRNRSVESPRPPGWRSLTATRAHGRRADLQRRAVDRRARRAPVQLPQDPPVRRSGPVDVQPRDDDFPVVELNGWKIGFLICYDLEFPENARRLALAGAELILVPTANMIPFDFVADVTVRSRAFENQCYVAYANYCGQEGEIHYCGQSSIAAPDGSRIAQAGLDEALIVGELDRQLMADSRAANRYLNDRRPELYHALNKR